MQNPEHSVNESAAAPGHVPEQYEAGYSARYGKEPFSFAATTSWQAGWNDANRELGSFEEIFTPAQPSLPFFGSGEEARRRGLPFDSSCSEKWKRSWIAADIVLGLEIFRSAE